METLLDSATGAPRRILKDLTPPTPEDTEGPELGDVSMLSSHTSAATDSSAHVSNTSRVSSVASSYKFPAHEGMFSRDYAPFSLPDLQQKHSEEMAVAGKDHTCDVKGNDSHALINALRSLQDKVKALELERVAASERYKRMKEETDRQLQAASSSSPRKTAAKETSFSSTGRHQGVVEEEGVPAAQSVDSDRLKAQLANQERELLHMRQLLQKAEGDKVELLSCNEGLKSSLQQAEEERERGAVERTATQWPLRTEHLCLAGGPRMRPLRHEAETGQMGARSSPSYSEPAAVLRTQSGLPGGAAIVGSQDNYEELQEKLMGLERLIQEEHREREKMKNTLSQVQTLAAANVGRPLPHFAYERPPVRQTAVAHKRKKSVKAMPPKAQFGKTVPGVHYRLDLKDVPFVVGKSTSESHSVAANYQKVVSLMKVHSHTLCGAIAASAVQREDRKQKREEGRTLVVPSGSMDEMKTMLTDLEGEFAGLAREHQLSVRQLQQCVSDGADVGDTQERMKGITDRMESKAEHIRIVKRQISTLQKHKQKQDRGGKKIKGTKPVINLDSSSNRRDLLKGMSYYEDRDLRSTSGEEEPTVAKKNLSMLRNMRNLQATLQRDDMWWE